MTDSTKRILETEAPGEAKTKKTKHLTKEEKTARKQAKAARKEAREKAGAGAEAGEAAEESDEMEDDSTAREGQDGYDQDEPAEEAPAGGKGKDPQLNWGPIITKGFKNHAQTKWSGEEWEKWYEESMKPDPWGKREREREGQGP